MIRLLGGLAASLVLLTLGGNEHIGAVSSMFDLAGTVLLAWALYIVDFRT